MSSKAETTTFAFAYRAYMILYAKDLNYYRGKTFITAESIEAVENAGGPWPDGFAENEAKFPEKEEPYYVIPITKFSVTYTLNDIPTANVSLNMGTRLDDQRKANEQKTTYIDFQWLNTKPRVKIKFSMYCSDTSGARKVIYKDDTIFNGYINNMTIDNSDSVYSVQLSIIHWMSDMTHATMVGSFIQNAKTESIGFAKFADVLGIGRHGEVDVTRSMLSVWPQLTNVIGYDTRQGCIIAQFIKPLFKLLAKNSVAKRHIKDLGLLKQNNFSYECICKLKTVEDDQSVLPVVWNEELRELMQNVIQNQVLGVTLEAFLGSTMWDKLLEICSEFDLAIIPGVNEFWIQPFTPGTRGVDSQGAHDIQKSKKISEVVFAQISCASSIPVKACVIPARFAYNPMLEQNTKVESDEKVATEAVGNNSQLVMFPRYRFTGAAQSAGLLPGKILMKQPPSWLTTNVLSTIPMRGVSTTQDTDDINAKMKETDRKIYYQPAEPITIANNGKVAAIKQYIYKESEMMKERVLRNRTNLYITYERVAKAYYFNELFNQQMLTISTPVTFGVVPGSTIYISKSNLATTETNVGFRKPTIKSSEADAYVGTARRITVTVDSENKRASTQFELNHVRPATLDTAVNSYIDQKNAVGTDVGDGMFSTDKHPYFTELFHYRQLIKYKDFMELVG